MVLKKQRAWKLIMVASSVFLVVSVATLALEWLAPTTMLGRLASTLLNASLFPWATGRIGAWFSIGWKVALLFGSLLYIAVSRRLRNARLRE